MSNFIGRIISTVYLSCGMYIGLYESKKIIDTEIERKGIAADIPFISVIAFTAFVITTFTWPISRYSRRRINDKN